MGLTVWQTCDAIGCKLKANHRVTLTLDTPTGRILATFRACFNHRNPDNSTIGSIVTGQTVDSRLWRTEPDPSPRGEPTGAGRAHTEGNPMNPNRARLAIVALAVAIGLALATTTPTDARPSRLAGTAQLVGADGQTIETLPVTVTTGRGRRAGRYRIDGRWGTLPYDARIVIEFDAVDPILVIDPPPFHTTHPLSP